VLWALVAVALALITVAVVRAVARHRRNARAREAGRPMGPKADGRRRASPPDWRGAAARGDYDGAIHLLLLDVLGRLPKGAAAGITSSWTSREIVSRGTLTGEAREALEHLVRAVEQTHFGGLPADENLFVRCRDAHRRLCLAT